MTCRVVDGRRRAPQAATIPPEPKNLQLTACDLLPLSVAVLIAIPGLGSCIGVGMAAMEPLEGGARRPERVSELQTRFQLAVGVTASTGGGAPLPETDGSTPVRWTCRCRARR